MVFPKVNRNYVDEHLLKHIEDGIANNSFKHLGENVFVYPISLMASVYIIIEDNEVKGGATISSVRHSGMDFIYPKIVKKFVEDYPGLALKIYKQASKDWELPVVSEYANL
jgi:hypothetical protein